MILVTLRGQLRGGLLAETGPAGRQPFVKRGAVGESALDVVIDAAAPAIVAAGPRGQLSQLPWAAT